MTAIETGYITSYQVSATATQKGIDAVRRCRDFIRATSAAHMAVGGSDRLTDLYHWASDRCAALTDAVLTPHGATWGEWAAWVEAGDTCAAIDDYLRHVPEHGETVGDLLAWIDRVIEEMERKPRVD